MRYTIEIFTRYSSPLLTYECDAYWVSSDGNLLHMKNRNGGLHVIVPFSNILHFSAAEIS